MAKTLNSIWVTHSMNIVNYKPHEKYSPINLSHYMQFGTKNIVLVILFFSFTSFAQNFKLGFDLGISQVRISFPNGNGILGVTQFPLSYHLNFTIEASENLSFQTKIGRLITTEFGGWEFGLNGAYKFYTPLYVKCGVLQHSNEGGGISNQLIVSFASILMVQFGIGVDMANFFSIGLDYYIPSSKKIIVWRGLGVKEPQEFDKMKRLAFNFGWNI